LPAELASRFTVVEELPTSGSEADVVLVDELSSGSRRVLKLYRRGIAPDEEALSRLALADRAHVVEVIDRGWAGGCWFEILEYCKFGSLRDLLEGGYVPRTDELVSEVATALIHVHEHGLVHRDLKPENLLVRTVVPFDLVLGDFGTVRAVDASVRWTRAWGTPQYSPPEFEGGEVSTAWDWWSCGMIVAEITAGHHPFELPGGVLLDDRQIRSAVAQRPVDLSDVSDPRTHLLCQGLLTRDRHHRWGGPQVTEWLEGGSPSVVADSKVPAGARTRSVLFGGVEHSSPIELAVAFQQRWGEALRRLFQERDGDLVGELERLLRHYQLDEAVRILTPGAVSAAELPGRFADLLAEMDPELDPVYNGIGLTPAGLETAALEVIRAGGEGQQGAVLDEVSRQNILIKWRQLPRMGHGPALHDAWVAAIGEIESTVKGFPANSYQPGSLDWVTARAWLLLCVLNPEHHTAQLAGLVDGLELTYADQQPWWNTLRHTPEPTPTTLVLTFLSQPAATQQTHKQQEQAREEKAVAAQRQREQERAQREAARQAAVPRLEAMAKKNGDLAFGFIFLWFFFFVGAPFSLYCLVQCHACARSCRELGIPEPKDNRAARLLALAPCILFPLGAIIVASTVHGA
jgi:hypothetical protein